MAAEAAEAAEAKVDDEIEVQDYKMCQEFELNSEN